MENRALMLIIVLSATGCLTVTHSHGHPNTDQTAAFKSLPSSANIAGYADLKELITSEFFDQQIRDLEKQGEHEAAKNLSMIKPLALPLISQIDWVAFYAKIDIVDEEGEIQEAAALLKSSSFDDKMMTFAVAGIAAQSGMELTFEEAGTYSGCVKYRVNDLDNLETYHYAYCEPDKHVISQTLDSLKKTIDSSQGGKSFYEKEQAFIDSLRETNLQIVATELQNYSESPLERFPIKILKVYALVDSFVFENDTNTKNQATVGLQMSPNQLGILNALLSTIGAFTQFVPSKDKLNINIANQTLSLNLPINQQTKARIESMSKSSQKNKTTKKTSP